MSTTTRTGTNKRRHLRYSTAARSIYQILIEEGPDDGVIVDALVVNKSHSGFACVIAGSRPADGASFQHVENDKIRTLLVLRHARELADGIQLLGFERTDAVTRVTEPTR